MAKYHCGEHDKDFFKKGKMKGYAHPIEDGDGETIGWCNLPREGEELAAQAKEQIGDEPVVVKDPRPPMQRPVQSGGKDVAIARAVALKAATKLAAASKIEVKNIGAYARKFEEYLMTGMSSG